MPPCFTETLEDIGAGRGRSTRRRCWSRRFHEKKRVAKSASFANYDILRVTLNMPDYPMRGAYRFVKVYDDQGQTFFLGETDPNAVFDITVDKPKPVKKVTVEIFTENQDDHTVSIDIPAAGQGN